MIVGCEPTRTRDPIISGEREYLGTDGTSVTASGKMKGWKVGWEAVPFDDQGEVTWSLHVPGQQRKG